MPATTTAPAPRPLRPIEARPLPLARGSLTVCSPRSGDAVTVEVLVIERPDDGRPRDVPALLDAGWRGFGSDELEVLIRVIQ